MPKFKYEAMDSKGKTVKKEITARDTDDAVSKIKSEGLFPTRVKEVSDKKKQKSSAPAADAGNKKKIDSSGAVLLGEGRACLFAQDYTPLIIFAGEAAKYGLLNWYEYP